jgi:CubicO group peptidase (beta-lactamase class C family)
MTTTLNATRNAESTVRVAAVNGRDVERVTRAVDQLMRRHRIPGLSLAITNADRPLLTAGFGRADLATGALATDSTQYLWFSLTKIVTATTAMRLSDLGVLDLGRPVSDFIPDHRARPGRTPTVRQLLDHTAGVANPIPVRWVRPAEQPAPDPGEFLATLLARHRTAKYPVGGAARYSNLGYLMLADIIAQAAGRPFTETASDLVLRPLEMTSTGFTYMPSRDVAVGYLRAPRIASSVLRLVLPAGVVGERIGPYIGLNRFLVNGAGYGGLVGTVTDAARLAAMHLADGTLDGRRVLRPETARAMREITAPGKPFDLGIGWYRKPSAHNTTAVEHLGAGGGFYNAMRLYPDLGLGIVAMANTTSAYDHATLFDLIAGLDWTDPR